MIAPGKQALRFGKYSRYQRAVTSSFRVSPSRSGVTRETRALPLQFRREIGDDFFEARIAAERIIPRQ